MSWSVHKFGGTSLGEARLYASVASIIEAQTSDRKAIVVSAMAGVTDLLVDLVLRASDRDESYPERLDRLAAKQRAAIEQLLPADVAATRVDSLARDVEDIRDLLKALWLMQAPPKNALDVVSGYGELWSAQLLASHMETTCGSVTWLNARSVLIVEQGRLSPVVDWEASAERLRGWLADSDHSNVIITGYIASDREGVPTTLGRNGSDYSASIFGRLLEAEAIHIWTDVDGVLSADPGLVAEPSVLDELSYHEAMELAYFGAKVLHPSTMAPAIESGIPIWIRNSFRPEIRGSRIHHGGATDSVVKGFATIDDITLLNLEGTGMLGVPGIAERLFGALQDAEVSVVTISQGSSEHSICWTVPGGDTAAARIAAERAFEREMREGQIQTLEISQNCAILAAVGDRMAGIPGVSAELFGALGRAGVNVKAIAQGSSERNISVVLDRNDATRALRAVHSAFYLSEQTLSIGLIGPGVVGSALLDQLQSQHERLRSEFLVDLRVRAIAGSSSMLLSDSPIDLTRWKEETSLSSVPTNLAQLADHIQADSMPHSVLIDCTASGDVASQYSEWLGRGIHVITPNKRAGTAALSDYERLRATVQKAKRHFLYETTVGAALPILQTLRDLIQTGDEIYSIEGVFSGTLSYLFNRYDGSVPFSQIVLEAKERGYTEPDPREDLSGVDVARKVVILAREMDLRLELGDVPVEGLVPQELASVEAHEFLDRLADFDAEIQARVSAAAARGEVLRFVGTIDSRNGSSVGLRLFGRDHPFARAQLTDNIVLFRTRRYHENPLVVQGPGAGPEVTAGGVFSDLLRLASYLGATL